MENFNELDQSTTPSQESGSIISHALEIFKNTFLYCLLAVVLYYAFSYILQLLTGFDANNVVVIMQEQAESGSNIDYSEVLNVPGLKTYAGVTFLTGIILAPIFTSLIYVANKSNFKQKISVADLFFCYKQNFVNIALLSLITYIVFTITISLCVLPAIFIMPFFFLAYPIIIFENVNVVDAIKKSFNIAKENYGKLLLISFLAGLIALVGILLCCVGVYLTYPFLFIAMYSTYCAFCGAPKELN